MGWGCGSNGSKCEVLSSNPSIAKKKKKKKERKLPVLKYSIGRRGKNLS
jgi:hypothetical protein